jgi:hypothetical protein
MLPTTLLLMPNTHAYHHQSDADSVTLSGKEDEENFNLPLASSLSLSMEVILCLGDDRVPDYLITGLAKIYYSSARSSYKGNRTMNTTHLRRAV